MTTIFLNSSGTNGCKNWFIPDPPNSNDDDHPGGATHMTIVAPAFEEPIIVPPERLHRPWLVPGWGTL